MASESLLSAQVMSPPGDHCQFKLFMIRSSHIT